MNKRLVAISKGIAVGGFYFLVFVASVFLTMTLLIKGDEVEVPNFTGKPLTEAYQIAARQGLVLRKEPAPSATGVVPFTVVGQYPVAGERIKEKTPVKIYVATEVNEVQIPDLVGETLKNCEGILSTARLHKGSVAAMFYAAAPDGTVIAQSPAAGTAVGESTGIDLLVSRGVERPSYLMPDLIGKEAAKVVPALETYGFAVGHIEEVAYFGLRPGVILKQFPLPGGEVGPRNQITLQVSK